MSREFCQPSSAVIRRYPSSSYPSSTKSYGGWPRKEWSTRPLARRFNPLAWCTRRTYGWWIAIKPSAGRGFRRRRLTDTGLALAPGYGPKSWVELLSISYLFVSLANLNLNATDDARSEVIQGCRDNAANE